jgi:hypothetical protein
LEALTLFSSTWKSVSLKIGPFLSFSLLLKQIIEQGAPLLEHMDIFLPVPYFYSSGYIDILLPRLPRLRHLGIAVDLPQRYIPNLKVPFQNLTTLELLSGFTMDNGLDIFEQAPNLISFTHEEMWGETERPRHSQTRPIIMHYLQCLQISTIVTDLDYFFDRLTLPSLSDITIKAVHHFPCQSFTSLLSRSGCSVSSLHLRLPIEETGLVQCLQVASSSLVCVSIESDLPCIGNNILFLLHKRNNDQTFHLCPQLKHLNLKKALFEWDVRDGMLARMIDARRGQSTLMEFTVPTKHIRDIAFLEALQKQEPGGRFHCIFTISPCDTPKH